MNVGSKTWTYFSLKFGFAGYSTETNMGPLNNRHISVPGSDTGSRISPLSILAAGCLFTRGYRSKTDAERRLTVGSYNPSLGANNYQSLKKLVVTRIVFL